MRPTDADVILVGGGLSNQLIAHRLLNHRSELSVLIVERGAVLGGNHTWSFHTTDVTAEESAWIEPLVDHRWDNQEVRFPGQTRVLTTGYRTILSERLAERVCRAPGLDVRCGTAVTHVEPAAVTLEDGNVLNAPLVIDGRGALRQQPLALAFQKFFGLEVETETPHGEAHPVIMDATVPQYDGYRFVYTLPFTPTRLLIEDTYYSEGADLSAAALEERVCAYACERGWSIRSVVRREQGVLPITLAGDIDAHWATLGAELPRAGLRAWLFHATTGYSVPYAVRLADRIAREPVLHSSAIAPAIEAFSREVWAEQAFMRLINRLLFVGAFPDERVAVMARFYRLGQGLIERFYAGRTTLLDKGRILSGRPPIPIRRGLTVIPPERAWDFVANQKPLTAELG